MDLWNSLTGTLCVEFSSADTACAIRKIAESSVSLQDMKWIDELTVQAKIRRKDWDTVCRVIDNLGGTVKAVRKNGLYWTGKRMLKRPVLLGFMLVYMLLSMYLPTRILFVRVEGNARIPERIILETADICGIRFGASRRHVRSEKVKNALIGMLPDLQWAGVNTRGCVAVISVKERSSSHSPENKNIGISSIVADHDAVIQRITVINGTALCKPGQAVKAGQTLISGYTDCGIAIRGTRAEGEIQGQTLRYLRAVSMVHGSQRVRMDHGEKKISLKIGKKLINFFKDSGISGSSCVKMYEEHHLTLPGGFELPIAVVIQRDVYYKTEHMTDTIKPDMRWLTKYCEAYLLEHMLAGQILFKDCNISFSGPVCTATGKYVCLELIGTNINEEIIDYNG